MRIGILGCGYIGEAAAIHWRNKGNIVTAATRRPDRAPHLASIADHVFLLSQPLELFLKQLDALLISVAPDSSASYADTYLQTAQRVAAALPNAPDLRNILYTGSLSVYGDHQGKWIDEETPPAPQNENSQILLETEKTLLNCCSDKRKVCIFRLGEIFGPERKIQERIRRTISSPFPGDGSSFTNLIHRDDCVGALDFALKHHLDGIYNLCNDFHVTRRQFYETICRQENLPSVRWDPTKKSSHQGNRRASNQKLKEAGFLTMWNDPFVV